MSPWHILNMALFKAEKQPCEGLAILNEAMGEANELRDTSDLYPEGTGAKQVIFPI